MKFKDGAHWSVLQEVHAFLRLSCICSGMTDLQGCHSGACISSYICWKYSPVPHSLHWGTSVTLLWCLPFRKICLHLNTIPTSIFCCCLFTLVPMDSTSLKQLTFCWWSPFWIQHMSYRLLAEYIVLARQSKICCCVQWFRNGPG